MRSLTQVVGVVLLFVGAIALVGTLGGNLGIGRETFRWLIPLAVIGLGLWVLATAGWGGRGLDASDGAPAGRPAGGPDAEAGMPHAPRAIQRTLGEIEVVGPMALGPSRFQTMLGEIRLDLTRADIPAGETPVSVSTLIGEIRVLLPPGVGAIVRGRTLLGDVEALGRIDGPIMPDRIVSTDDYATSPRRIRLDVQSGIGRVGVRRARPDVLAPSAAPADGTSLAGAVSPPAPVERSTHPGDVLSVDR